MRILTLGSMLVFLAVPSGYVRRYFRVNGRFRWIWIMAAGHGTPIFVLEQHGHKLTGTYSGPVGEQQVSGTVAGDTAEFGFEFTREGQAIKANYSAKIESGAKMSGTVTFTNNAGTSSGNGKWTAAKQ